MARGKNPDVPGGVEGSARRRPKGTWRRLVGRYLRPLGEALMVHGGVDMYLTAADGNRARLHSLDSGFRLMLRTDADGPPPGHPERLRPDVPLTRQELALLQDLLNEVPGHRR
ncbi:DUF6059 family protein [Streptomyces xanthochromogenes]|uniref:Uncharacterized protein n=1 Tax=Streptomyces xanthochromogenes TaxID=67384 RepID=A0ABQ2ZUQ5_9ACTN|nr:MULTISPECIES: DUF6059 family protein [Streptomyces]MYV91489.1 hypothetical protein [Streptomyces sp. SID1034]GGY23522.1 hypothetical protein GCM10010326_16330 [Streptomyces xanthochromogenes]GHB70596.1 hypothetical protein GCM10010331_68330 [Streptomyces xanthochromogenes]